MQLEGHTTAQGTASSLSINRPTRLDASALQVGDAMLLVAGYGGTPERPSAPVGWVLQYTQENASSGVIVWAKYVGAGEATSYSLTTTTTVTQASIIGISSPPATLAELIVEITGAGSTANGTSVTVSGMVANTPNSILLGFFHNRANNIVNSTTCTPPTNYTEKFDINSGNIGSSKHVFEGVYRTSPPSGLQTDITFASTEGGSSRSAVWIELRPQVQVATPTPIDPPSNQVGVPFLPTLFPRWQGNAFRNLAAPNSGGATVGHEDPGASTPLAGLWVVAFAAANASGGAGTITPPSGYTLLSRVDQSNVSYCVYTKIVPSNPVLPTNESFLFSNLCDVEGFFGVLRGADLYATAGGVTDSDYIGDTSAGLSLAVPAVDVADADSRVISIAFAEDSLTAQSAGPDLAAPTTHISRVEYTQTASATITNRARTVLLYDYLESGSGVTASGTSVTANRNTTGLGFAFVVKPALVDNILVSPPIDPPLGQVPATGSVLHITDPSDPGTFGLPETATEITADRTRTRKKYAHVDGRVSEVIRQQLHYQEGIQYFDLNLDLLATGPSEYTMNEHDIRVKALTSALEPALLVTERKSGKGLQIALPGSPSQVFKNRVSFLWRGRTWNYQIRERGLKLSATFNTAQGLTSYDFYYDVIGGASAPIVDSAGNIITDTFTIPRPFLLGADGEIYDAGPWVIDSVNEKFSIAFDDSVLPSGAFPYVLDPTTDLPITADPNDDWAYKQDSAFPPASGKPVLRTPSTFIGPTKSRGLDPSGSRQYTVGVGLLKFDTSKTPANSIVGDCKLRIRVKEAQAVDGGTLYIQWFNWTGADADYVNGVVTTENAVTAYSISGLLPGQDLEIPLDNADAFINRGGTTGLRLMISNVGTPTGSNRLLFYASEDADNPPPTLVYTYSEIAARRGVSIGVTDGGTTLDLVKPDGSSVGDAALIAVWGGTIDGTSPGTRISYAVREAGFTSLGFRNVGTSDRAEVFIKRLAEADSAISTYHVDWTSSRDVVGALMVYQAGSGNVDDFVTALDGVAAQNFNAPQASVDYPPERVVVLFAGTKDETFTPTAASGLDKWFQAKAATTPRYILAGSDFIHKVAGLTPSDKTMRMATNDTDRVTITIPLISTQAILSPTSVDPPANQVGTPAITPGISTVRPVPINPPVGQVGTPNVDKIIRATNPIPPPDPLTQVPAPTILRGLSPVSIPPPSNQVGTPVVAPGNRFIDVAPINPPAGQVPNPKTTELQISPIPIPPPTLATQVSPAAIALEPPITQVLSLEAKKEALKLSGERGRIQYSTHLFLSNIRGDELQELPGAIAATVNMSNARDVAWNLTLDVMVTDAFDPVHDFVLVAMDVRSDLIREWSRYYLGLYRFALPGGTDNPEGSFWKLDGQSLEYLLLRNDANHGYNLKRGDFILEAVENILKDKGNIPNDKIAFPPRSQDVRSKHGAHFNPIDDGEDARWLAICNNLLLQGGFEPLQTDAYGRFTTRSAKALEDIEPAVTYGPRIDGYDDMIIGQPLDFEPDYANFANEIMVYSKETMEAEPDAEDCSNTEEEPAKPIYYTARNHNPDSPVSIGNLGYTISRTIGYDQIANKTAAKRLARRELSKASSYSISRSIPTMLDPRRGIDEAYALRATNKRGILVLDGEWSPESYDLPLPINGPPGTMTHTVNRIEKITEEFPF